MKDLYLHRIADLQGQKNCAMTAVAKMLGYEKVSDTPDEVDPGLSALVTLLNDRADGGVRQVLISRLPHVLHTGRTELAWLIAEVFMPSAIRRNKFKYEAQNAENWDDLRDAAKIYGSLGARFLEADGRGYLAGGCITLAAALETTDPTTQDILAVSAAGEIASFETGEGWSELLHILDYVIGLTDTRPYIGQQMGEEIEIALSAPEVIPAGLFEGLPDHPTPHEAANFFGNKIAAMARIIGEDGRIGYQPRDCAALLLQVAIGLIFNNGSPEATGDQLRDEVKWLVRQMLGAGEAFITARGAPEVAATPATLH